jgi:hypothetical protein
MLREGPIPRAVHGILEYLLGVFMVAAPFLMDFDSGVPLGISIAVGVVLLVLAAITEGPTGLVQQLPVTAHFTGDLVLSLFLVAGPFILGFGDDPTPRNLFIALGVALLLISIGTRFRSVDAAPAAPRTRAAPPDATKPRPSTAGGSHAAPGPPVIGDAPTPPSVQPSSSETPSGQDKPLA